MFCDNLSIKLGNPWDDVTSTFKVLFSLWKVYSSVQNFSHSSPRITNRYLRVASKIDQHQIRNRMLCQIQSFDSPISDASFRNTRPNERMFETLVTTPRPRVKMVIVLWCFETSKSRCNFFNHSTRRLFIFQLQVIENMPVFMSYLLGKVEEVCPDEIGSDLLIKVWNCVTTVMVVQFFFSFHPLWPCISLSIRQPP